MTAGGFSAETFGGSTGGLSRRRRDGEGPSSDENNAHMLFQSGALNEQQQKKEKEGHWLKLVGEDGHVFQTRLEDSYFALEEEGIRHDGLLLNPHVFEVENGVDLRYTNEAA